MKINPEVLARYHRNLCSRNERLAVQQWLEDNSFDFDDHLQPDENAEEQMWSSLEEQIDKSEQKKSVYHSLQSQKPLKLIPFLAAAAVVTLLLFAYIFRWSDRGIWQSVSTNESIQPVLITVKAPAGQRTKHVLPDGSEIHLNAGSELRYPQSFRDSIRLVYLSGEAYFQIQKDTSHPFVIQTAANLTRVLGTSFNLKAYTDEAPEVTVTEGKVRFSDREQSSVTLTAGQQATYESGHFLQKQVDARRYFAWSSSEIVFDDTPFEKAVKVIERWYDVKILLPETSLRNRSFTGSFQNPSLAALMEDMSYVLNFKYKISRSAVTIYQ